MEWLHDSSQNKLNRCNNSKLRSSNMKLLKVPKSITKLCTVIEDSLLQTQNTGTYCRKTFDYLPPLISSSLN